MSTENLHRPMHPLAEEVGANAGEQISRITETAFADVMALEVIGDRRHHEALSVVSELTAGMAAFMVRAMRQHYTDATEAQCWMTAMTDIQLRAQARLLAAHLEQVH